MTESPHSFYSLHHTTKCDVRLFKDAALLAAVLGVDLSSRGGSGGRLEGKGVELCVYHSRADLVDLPKDASWGTRKRWAYVRDSFSFWPLRFKIGSHVADFKITV